MVTVRWRGLDVGASAEVCTVEENRRGVVVDGAVHTQDWTCTYRLLADARWHFRRLELSVGDRTLEVVRDDDGWRVDGQARPDLAEALEVDIAVTPLSNTLPIRRLALGTGESADIVTAYVTVPDLRVVTDPQRYTRTGALEYLYESRDSDFRRTVTVDEHRLVVTYPGLFERTDEPDDEKGSVTRS